MGLTNEIDTSILH